MEDLTELLAKAIKIAIKAHRGQTDRNGMPYINHPMRVMEMGKTLEEKIVGILHDVVEDSPEYPLSYLVEKGFPPNIVFAVNCLTKRPEETDYNVYMSRVKKSPLAMRVKINDLTDNMDLRRCRKLLEEKDLKRYNKYLSAYHELITMTNPQSE